MKQSDEWYIYIQDDDEKMYAVTGPISWRFVGDWISKVVDEQDSGRDITCQDISKEQLSEVESHARRNGLTETDVKNIIDIPKDRSHDYLGGVPKYAETADRSKLVKILCKGKCGVGRWAELNKNNPGLDVLRKASHGEYEAKCLRCGSIAKDNYNWHQ